MEIGSVRKALSGIVSDRDLVEEMNTAYAEAKRRYLLGDLRPQAVEGGRFTEAVFRILQELTMGLHTPVGKPLPTVDVLLTALANAHGHSDSVRLHIPRTLRLIYDIRNKRDIAHLGTIDPNQQDAALVIHCMDWVLAELVREHHPSLTPDQARQLIDAIVLKNVPAVQFFGEHPRILKDLSAGDHSLTVLYAREPNATTHSQLVRWVRPSMRANLRRTLTSLESKHLIHMQDGEIRITRKGQAEAEKRGLLASGI